MTTILEQIFKYKKEELEHDRRQIPLAELKARVRDAAPALKFRDSLRDSVQPFAVIAELKRRSPSKGLLCDPYDPLAIAQDYEENGATALSVLTDEHFFGGHLDHLREIRKRVALPLLRKDFVWDLYQIYAAREAGADAILLIVAMLEISLMEDLQGLGRELGMAVLVEVHNEKECLSAKAVRADLIGINNRDLKTFKVDVSTTEQLLPLLPVEALKVSESGLDSTEILLKLKQQGVGAYLIGEALMKAKRPGKALAELLNSKS